MMKRVFYIFIAIFSISVVYPQAPPYIIYGDEVHLKSFSGASELSIFNATQDSIGAIAFNTGSGHLEYQYLDLTDVGDGCFTVSGSKDTLCVAGTIQGDSVVFANGSSFVIDSALSFLVDLSDTITIFELNPDTEFYGFKSIDSSNSFFLANAFMRLPSTDMIHSKFLSEGDFTVMDLLNVNDSGIKASIINRAARAGFSNSLYSIDYANGFDWTHNGTDDTMHMKFWQYGLQIDDILNFDTLGYFLTGDSIFSVIHPDSGMVLGIDTGTRKIGVISVTGAMGGMRLFDRTMWVDDGISLPITILNGTQLTILELTSDLNKFAPGTDISLGELSITDAFIDNIQFNWQGVVERVHFRFNFEIDNAGASVFNIELREIPSGNIITSTSVAHPGTDYEPKTVEFSTFIESNSNILVTNGAFITITNESGNDIDLVNNFSLLITRHYRNPLN